MMEEMIDLVDCRCGGSVQNNRLHIIAVDETEHSLPKGFQVICTGCGRRSIVSDDTDLICVSWNFDHGGYEMSEFTISKLIDKYSKVLSHTKLSQSDIRTELRSMFMEAGRVPLDITNARRTMREAFKKDPDFKKVYIANLSMRIFHDQMGIEDGELRDKISEQILDMLFEE